MNEVFAAFVLAVSRMRAQQREYFRTRSREALIGSKTAEREVDALLQELDSLQAVSGKETPPVSAG